MVGGSYALIVLEVFRIVSHLVHQIRCLQIILEFLVQFHWLADKQATQPELETDQQWYAFLAECLECLVDPVILFALRLHE
jgi:hypothetical protein